MSKVLKAEYDDATNTLRLLEPVEGIAAHEQVLVTIDQTPPKKPWSHLENSLKGENGESFARAIDEAYPIEPVRP
jgi:hypothetical protein